MTVKYCWSYAYNDAIGDFDSREDAVADFERSFIEEDYDLDAGYKVKFTTYEAVPVTKLIQRFYSDIGFKVDEIINGYADDFLGFERGDTHISATECEILGRMILDWFGVVSKLDSCGSVRKPVVHTFIVPDND